MKSFLKKVLIHLTRKKWFQSLLALFMRTKNPKKWVFVIGCYNSGTTLMENILSRHPDISGLPAEGVFLTDRLKAPEEFGWTRMWVKCREKLSMNNHDEAWQQKTANRIKRQWSFWFDSQKPVFVEKSISNMVRVPFFHKYFQPVYFIYVVRNGYAVSEGIRRRAVPKRWGNYDFPNGYPIELCASQWEATDELAQSYKKSNIPYLTVSYEELCTNTMAVMKNVTDYIGIEAFDKSILETSWQFQRSESEIKDMNFKSIQSLSPEEKEKIESVAGRTLKKYHYDK